MHAYSVGLTIAATVALLAFVAVSAVDGIYIHLVRLKLHARPESWREHLLHTARAVLFLPMLLALFGVVSGGMLLRIGLGAVMIDQVVEVLDMMSEKDSRASIGGLSSLEYVVHVLLTTLRSAAIALSLAARPISAFSLSSPWVLGELEAPWRLLVAQLVPGAAVIALLHVWLALRYLPSRARAAA